MQLTFRKYSDVILRMVSPEIPYHVSYELHPSASTLSSLSHVVSPLDCLSDFQEDMENAALSHCLHEDDNVQTQIMTSERHSDVSPLADDSSFAADISFILKEAAKSETGVTFWHPSQNVSVVESFRYSELLLLAEANKRAIRMMVGQRATKVILMHFDCHKQNIEMFWSIRLAGCIPVVSTPFSPDAGQRRKHLAHIKIRLDNPVCLTSARQLEQYPEMRELWVYTIEELHQTKNVAEKWDQAGTEASSTTDSPAVLMLTSGSTGNAKVVPLTHSQILASIQGKSAILGTTKKSRFLNWIGFDHVANLLEIHLHAMYLKAQQVHVQARHLIADPLRFAKIVDDHCISHSFAPNFFLAMLGKDLATAMNGTNSPLKLDLSSLQAIVAGGEANPVKTANNINSLLARFGASEQNIMLAYGLTEACAGLSYTRLDSSYEAHEKHDFCSIGRPTHSAKMRIVDANGQRTEPYELGLLELSGLVVFDHYYNDEEATKKAFSPDGWFKTGDRGYVDKFGMFNLAGREKEVVVINGVKYAPQDVESVLDHARLQGAVSSYYAVFSYREHSNPTEDYCIVYATSNYNDSDLTIDTVEQLAKTSSDLVGARPHSIIPLPEERLEKSSLGKLSRVKLQLQFEKGLFDNVKVCCKQPLTLFRDRLRRAPITSTQLEVVDALCNLLELPFDLISIDQTIFELGITSISLFRLEKVLRRRLVNGISIINFLNNPAIEAIASAIDFENSGIYDPVAQLQVRGSKMPLWLVHPASGNMLAFLPLARSVTDRPLYALTARGLRDTEKTFSSLGEMADTYHSHIKKTQGIGPYGILGYSLGSSIAFEIAKRLEAGGDQVAFCAALDSPPRIAPLVSQLDWTHAAVLVTFFLDLLPQTEVPQWTEKLRGTTKEETARQLLDLARMQGRDNLNLDSQQLLAIINIAYSFGLAARMYEPQGSVRKMDVFWCTPLHSVERSREKWFREYLCNWREYSKEEPAFHECEGNHADMINESFVTGFKERLDTVLAARGL